MKIEKQQKYDDFHVHKKRCSTAVNNSTQHNSRQRRSDSDQDRR